MMDHGSKPDLNTPEIKMNLLGLQHLGSLSNIPPPKFDVSYKHY